MSADANAQYKPPHRILMTADAVGGVWQYSLHLAKGLARSGCEILLVTFGPKPSDEQRAEARAIPRLHLEETSFALEWMPDPWSDVDRAGDWLFSAQKNFAAELVHLNGYSHGALNWDVPTLIVAHSCVFSWWNALRPDRPGPEWFEYKDRVTRGLNNCGIVIAPSRYMATAISSEYGIAPQKIRVIHNSAVKPATVPEGKQPFALAAGRLWDPAKNLQLLTEIAPDLDWELRLAGSAEGAESTNQAANVCYLGALPHRELLHQFQRASLFLHPALYEPFGLAVLEAAGAGCCLVLSDIPSLRELWQGAAVFVSPRDREQWVYEVNSLTRNFEARDLLARAARSRAQLYHSDQMLEQYLSVYQSLIAGGGDCSGVAA